MQRFALIVKIQHVGPETVQRATWLFGRPLVRVVGLPFTPNLIALLEIRRLAADLLDLGDVLELADLLPPWRRIASVSLWGGPADTHLGFLGLCKEACAPGERALEHVGRDSVVLEIDKAGVLKAAQDSLGSVAALIGAAVRELGEVDKLEGGVERSAW